MHTLRRCILWGCLALLCLFFNSPLAAQDCECTKNHKRIFKQNRNSWMKGQYSDELVIKEHPYTTFSKFHDGSYYNRSTTMAGRLNVLRSDLQNFQSLSGLQDLDPRNVAKEIYDAIYDFADKRIPEPDAKLNGSHARIEEVQCIGNALQKLVGEYFLANKMIFSMLGNIQDKQKIQYI